MREREIFDAALAITDPTQRADYLLQVCAGNSDLREHIAGLLAKAVELDGFLETPDNQGTLKPVVTEKPGTMIGPYKLLEQIGEGGFGIVFMAEQLTPVRRKVALKVIKPGMDSNQIIARFDAERQALAMMDHPNIAKVHDAGATASGRPYFVMELVKGLPITEYCDENQLALRQRLDLFIPVCQAVLHAHQKGIIHRDIKPSNVLITLVDGAPVVKIIDFGIAKAIGQQLTDKTLFTNFAHMIGTPLYMSPEQATLSGVDVDTRSDIYSLGVLLYELLTGTTPFDKNRLKQAAYDEMRRIIREEEPPKPSTRVSTLGQAAATVSEQRQSDPRRLSQLFRGELDWIVMKALDKDRNRRYESASALAADVQRHLHDELVAARPPSAFYKFRKFARRNKRSLTTALVLLVAVLAVVGIIGWMARDRATRAALIEQAVGEDLKEADLWQKQEQWANALKALERAMARMDESGLPTLQTKVDERRRNAALVVHVEKFAELGASLTGPYMRDVSGIDQEYRAAFKNYGLDGKSLSLVEMVRLIRVSPVREHLVKALDNWAFYLDHWGKDSKPAEVLRSIARQADDDKWRQQLRDPRTFKDREALMRLAESEDVLAQPPENVMILFHLLEAATHKAGKAPRSRRDVLGSQDPGVRMLLKLQKLHPNNFWINLNLGYHLANDPELAGEAIGYCRVALAVQPQNPLIYHVLGGTFWEQKKLSQAAEAFRKAIELEPGAEGCMRLGESLKNLEMLDLADEAFGKARALAGKTDSAGAYVTLGNLLGRQGKLSEAEAAARTAINLKQDYADAYTLLGLVLIHQKRLPEAEAACRKAIELDHKKFEAHFNLGKALFDQRKPLPEVEEVMRRAIELKDNDAKAHYNLGVVLFQLGKFADSAAAHKRGDELSRPSMDRVRKAERFALLDAKLPMILSGAVTPADAAEHLDLAALCGLEGRQLYAAATRFSSRAFAADPKLAKGNDLYNAACAAARAGCGQGKDAANLDAKEYARLRGQAHLWLQAALAAEGSDLNSDPDKARQRVSQQMQWWQADPDFNGVRSETALATLPEAEHQEWQKLWDDVEELKKRAAGAQVPADASPGRGDRQ